MNPNIWGPLAWNLFSDLCYHYDSLQNPNESIKTDVRRVFEYFRFLLPCKHCRVSYTNYYSILPILPFIETQNMSAWLWSLHELVNNKLDKKDRLDYPVYIRRMNAWTRIGSPQQVWDLLFILAMNYDDESNTFEEKRNFTLKLLLVLPNVLPYKELRRVLRTKKITSKNLESKNSFLKWLYRKRVKYHRRCGDCAFIDLPSFDELVQRYTNAKATQKDPLVCGPL